MKKFLIISWSLFIAGFLLKLFHVPGANPLLILGTGCLLVHSFLYIKQRDKDLPKAFLYLAFSTWTFYILFLFMYWGGIGKLFGFQILFIIAVLCSISWLVLFITSKTRFKLQHAILVLYIILGTFLSFAHSHRIYYFFYLNPVVNNHSRDTNFRSWDKYSWFLYISDKKEEALEANRMAQQALELAINQGKEEDVAEYDPLIEKHKEQILSRTWESYP